MNQFIIQWTPVIEYHNPIIVMPIPQMHPLKKLIVDNIEVFLICVALFYLITIILVVRWYRAKNKQIEYNFRKESSCSDDTCKEDEGRDKSSSTQSSPQLTAQDNQLIPLDRVQSTELVSLNGQVVKVKKEKRVEFERDPVNNVINKIETNTHTLVHQMSAEETDQMIQDIKGQLNLKYQQNIRGIRSYEEQDMVLGTTYQQYEFVTDWSKNCENGKFKKMYKLHEEIGKGAFGHVYKCIKELDQKWYAIKQIYFEVKNESQIKEHRIFREINALSQLNHPNIVRYYTSWIEELDIETKMLLNSFKSKLESIKRIESQESFQQNQDYSYLDQYVQFVGPEQSEHSNQSSLKDPKILQQSFHISDFNSDDQSFIRKYNYNPNSKFSTYILHIEMEMCEKKTLKDFIESQCQNRLLIDNIFYQILQGVQYIHQKGFIHRDLKPQNIFLDQNGGVKIGDLGLSIECNSNIESSKGLQFKNQDHTGNVGTPMYMAPEVSQNQYDSSADIFSLGIIYLEMLWPMKTQSQRIRVIEELSSKQKLPNKFIQLFEKESLLIKQMVDNDFKKRPLINNILEILSQK